MILSDPIPFRTATAADPRPPEWPHNLEAEQALLGCLLFDNAISRSIGAVQAEHFYEPFHQRLFAEILTEIDAGRLADPIVLVDRFRADQAFNDLGGIRYFADLVDRAPPAANANDYARVIVDLAVRREMLALGRDGGEIQAFLDRMRDIAPAKDRRGRLRDNIVSAAALAAAPAPERAWHVDGWIPSGTVTILNGDGGTGKSLLGLQLGVATVAGAHWLGRSASAGRCLFISAEDDRDELHRRLRDIVTAAKVPAERLDGLDLISLAGEDALLAVPDGRTGPLRPTALFQDLEASVAAQKPALVVLDTLADLFGGEENNRAHARQFIGLLRGLALKGNTTVLLLAHPSLAGMASGTGSSGSTAWNNSVRSRLFFDRVKNGDGSEDDTDLRVLKTVKANYGPKGEEIRLRWQAGAFVTETYANSTGQPSRDLGAYAEAVFQELLQTFELQGRKVSDSPGWNYAPKEFAADPRAKGIGKAQLALAMSRLFAAGQIEVVTVGPPSRPQKKIVRAMGAAA